MHMPFGMSALPIWILLLLNGPSPDYPNIVRIPSSANFTLCGKTPVEGGKGCCLAVKDGLAYFGCGDPDKKDPDFAIPLENLHLVNFKAKTETVKK